MNLSLVYFESIANATRSIAAPEPNKHSQSLVLAKYCFKLKYCFEIVLCAKKIHSSTIM